MKKMMVFLAMVLMTCSFAFADDYDNCGGNQCGDFGQFNLVGLSNFGGGFAAGFDGDEGYAMGEKNGYADVDLNLSGSGDGCGSECSDVSWSFEGMAGEHVTSGAGALTTTPGNVAAALNEGTAYSGISLMYGPAQPQE